MLGADDQNEARYTRFVEGMAFAGDAEIPDVPDCTRSSATPERLASSGVVSRANLAFFLLAFAGTRVAWRLDGQIPKPA